MLNSEFTLFTIMQFNLSGPVFDVSDGVRLLCSANTPISIFSTSYGKSRYNVPTYGAPFFAAPLFFYEINTRNKRLTEQTLSLQYRDNVIEAFIHYLKYDTQISR